LRLLRGTGLIRLSRERLPANCLIGGLLRDRLHSVPFLFGACCFGGALCFSLAHLQPFFFDCLLDPLTGILASLRPHRRKVAVLRTVQIRP
jgi:hypothetical protein